MPPLSEHYNDGENPLSDTKCSCRATSKHSLFLTSCFNLRFLYLEKKQLTRTKIHGEQHSQRKSCSVNIEGSSTQEIFIVNNDKRRCSRTDMMPMKNSGDNNRKTWKQEQIEHHMTQYKVWDHIDISTGL